MGCKSITAKRQTDKNAFAGMKEVAESGNNKNINLAPTAGALQVKLVVNFQGKVLIQKSYDDAVKVESVISEINEVLPNFSKDASYSYTVRGNELGDKADCQIRTLLTASGQVTKGQTTEEISVEVSLKGLEDIPLETKAAYAKMNLLAKPVTEPFGIVIFDKTTGRIEIENLQEQLEKETEMHLFSDLSAYCNGADHLFISGGEFVNSENGENGEAVILGQFWDIDLTKKSIYRSKKGFQTPRKLHSMIYIPNSYVFVVGGIGVKQVEYFDTVRKEILIHSELIEERTEPALALINNSYLFAFSGNSANQSAPSFEKINLRSDSKTWELVKPSLAPETKFTQNFFAVSHFEKDQVIFIGGMNISEEEENYSFLYDYKTNEVRKSKFLHSDNEFSEKFLIPIKEGNNVVLPQMTRENISLVRFTNAEGVKQVEFQNDTDVSVAVEGEVRERNEFMLFQDELMEEKEIILKSKDAFVSKENVIIDLEPEEKQKQEDTKPFAEIKPEEIAEVVQSEDLKKEENNVKEEIIVKEQEVVNEIIPVTNPIPEALNPAVAVEKKEEVIVEVIAEVEVETNLNERKAEIKDVVVEEANKEANPAVDVKPLTDETKAIDQAADTLLAGAVQEVASLDV